MNENKKIAINSVIIFIRLCVSSIVGIIASRIVLDALGASDYGLYNVVGGIVTVLNVFNTAMLSTTYRYIAFEVGKGANGNPNKVFNSSLAIHAGFVLFILMLGATVGEWYVGNHLNVLPEKLADARFVFRISILTTAISTLLVPFQGLVVAQEKFSLTAIVEIVTQLVKLLLVVFVLRIATDRLRMYSCIMLINIVLSSVAYYFYCLKHYKDIIRIRISKDGALYKEMLSFASWTLFGAVANVGKVQGCAIIINYFFGTVVNAAFAIASQIENIVLMFARSLNNAAIPQITKNFSGGDKGRSVKLTAYISKYTFILMSFVAFPMLIDMDFVLNLWLKEVPEGTSLFCKLIVLSGLFGCLGEGIPAMVNATGKIKAYQLVVHSLLLSGLPFGVIAYKLGADFYAISLVYCGIMAVIGFVKLYMLRRVMTFDVKDFFRISYSRILFMSIPLVIYYLFYNPTQYSFGGHIAGMALSEVLLVIVILCFGLDKRELNVLKNYIKK